VAARLTRRAGATAGHLNAPRPAPQLAIKLCTAAAAKHPASAYIKSLRSLALVRSGKQEEAWEVSGPPRPSSEACSQASRPCRACPAVAAQAASSSQSRAPTPPPPPRTVCPALQAAQQVLRSATSDESALHTLALTLKPLDKLHRLTAAYELSVDAHPGSTDLLRGLFQCHVRCEMSSRSRSRQRLVLAAARSRRQRLVPRACQSHAAAAWPAAATFVVAGRCCKSPSACGARRGLVPAGATAADRTACALLQEPRLCQAAAGGPEALQAVRRGALHVVGGKRQASSRPTSRPLWGPQHT
jgi:hypothetical protein